MYSYVNSADTSLRPQISSGSNHAADQRTPSLIGPTALEPSAVVVERTSQDVARRDNGREGNDAHVPVSDLELKCRAMQECGCSDACSDLDSCPAGNGTHNGITNGASNGANSQSWCNQVEVAARVTADIDSIAATKVHIAQLTTQVRRLHTQLQAEEERGLSLRYELGEQLQVRPVGLPLLTSRLLMLIR